MLWLVFTKKYNAVSCSCAEKNIPPKNLASKIFVRSSIFTVFPLSSWCVDRGVNELSSHCSAHFCELELNVVHTVKHNKWTKPKFIYKKVSNAHPCVLCNTCIRTEIMSKTGPTFNPSMFVFVMAHIAIYRRELNLNKVHAQTEELELNLKFLLNHDELMNWRKFIWKRTLTTLGVDFIYSWVITH